MSNISTRGFGLAGLMAAFLAVAAQAEAAGTPEQNCETGKNKAAGKYASCIANARKILIAGGDMATYDGAVAKCEAKIVASWDKLEAKAAAAEGSCPSTGDESPIEDFATACDDSIAAALAGGPLGPDPVTCAGDLTTCNSDLSTCEGDLVTTSADLVSCDSDLNECLIAGGRIPKTGQTSCSDTAGVTIPCAGSGYDGQFQAGDSPNFVDNGNGTITDYVTGLMWEKLGDNGGLHDKDNTYAGLPAAFAKATAANTAVFAGHTDWRVPNLRELESIPNYENYNPAVPPIFHSACTTGCSPVTCSCTKNNIYYTSTTYIGYDPACWKINMTDGDIYAGDKVDTHYVRLVRSVN